MMYDTNKVRAAMDELQLYSISSIGMAQILNGEEEEKLPEEIVEYTYSDMSKISFNTTKGFVDTVIKEVSKMEQEVSSVSGKVIEVYFVVEEGIIQICYKRPPNDEDIQSFKKSQEIFKNMKMLSTVVKTKYEEMFEGEY